MSDKKEVENETATPVAPAKGSGISENDRALIDRMTELGIPAYKCRIQNQYGFKNEYFAVKELQKVEGSFAWWTCTCNFCGGEFHARSVDFAARRSCSTSCSKLQQSIRTHLGNKYGCFTITALNPQHHPTKGRLCTVTCDCGREYEKSMGNVVKPGKEMSCCGPNCSLHDSNTKYIGKKINSLLIKAVIPPETINGMRIAEKFLCECECGSVTVPESKSVLKGITMSCGCYHKKMVSSKTGDKNSNWKGGITTEYKADRTSSEKWEWVEKVHDKYDYTCQCCGYKNARGNKLHAHHIENFSSNPEARFDVDNGISLCQDCHNDFHAKFGRVSNSQSQLTEYIQNYRPEQPRDYSDKPAVDVRAVTEISIDYVMASDSLVAVNFHTQGNKRRDCRKVTKVFPFGNFVWFTDNLSHGIIYHLSKITGDEVVMVDKSYLSADGNSVLFEFDSALSPQAREELSQEGAVFEGICCVFEGDAIMRAPLFDPTEDESPETPSLVTAVVSGVSDLT